MSAKLTFCGGTGTVTGANFLLETEQHKLLVDCGMLQREEVCDDANFAPFPYDPASIDALLVTHAHADHIGRIPRLVRAGFKGSIHSTHATRDISAVMFEDAIRVMRAEVERHGCDMLYETEHAEFAMRLWKGHEYREPFSLGDFSVDLLDAGHILGSSVVRLARLGRAIAFSGDLGNVPEPLLNDTEAPEGVQYLVMESVYGDRVHEGRDGRKAHLRAAIEETQKKQGTLLIPSFSIERTQVLLFELNEMLEHEGLAPIPVYLDAPLGTRVTGLFRTYKQLLNPNILSHFERGDDPFSFPKLTVIQNAAESGAIHAASGAKVIIAGAGMSSGGRIRSHERHYLPEESTTLLFVGYQTPGSLGRRLQEGAKEVTIDGEKVRVAAQIDTLSGYSGHADREQLLDFVEHTGTSVERVFVAMGEPRSSLFLAQRIRDFLGTDAVAPEAGTSFDIAI